MATWQYRAWVLPLQSLSLLREGEETVDMLQEGAPHLWLNQKSEWLADCAAQLALGRGSSWHPTILIWGSFESEFLSETVEDGRIIEANCGLDVRTFSPRRAQEITRALGEHQLCLVDTDGHITPSPLWPLEKAVSESLAGRFVRDPKAFLKGLRNNHN